MREKQLFAPVSEALESIFGEIHIAGHWMPFDCTPYYAPEMGKGLERRMLAFRKLVSQESLADIKHETNRIEERFMKDDARRVNIDPGYLLAERFVLATGKNYAHRIYIGGNIYADLTLVYHNGTFRPLPWTYPDYARADMLAFLHRVRKQYLEDKKMRMQQL